MRNIIPILCAAALLAGCVIIPPLPPKWNPVTENTEEEYESYLKAGTSTVTGQAFLVQRGGDVVTAAGRTVTLDPATTLGNEWWEKAGRYWVHRALSHPSPAFSKARRTTVADADGRFKFLGLPAGSYYIRTEVTWEVGGYTPTQGGLIGEIIDVKDGEKIELVLNQFTKGPPPLQPPARPRPRGRAGPIE